MFTKLENETKNNIAYAILMLALLKRLLSYYSLKFKKHIVYWFIFLFCLRESRGKCFLEIVCMFDVIELSKRIVKFAREIHT